MIPTHGRAPSARELADELLDARTRTLLLVASVPEAELMAQHNTLMSPIVWDLGHIAHFEELWLIRNLEGPVEFGEMPGMFNPFENPRSVRGKLQLPGLGDSLDNLATTRQRVLRSVANGGAPKGDDDPLLRDGYVYRMVLQHEYQHNETILQALQLKEPFYRAPRAIAPPPGAPVAADADGMVRFPGGAVEVGTDDRSAAYDNERPRHRVELKPFRIGAWPVTNGDYQRFIADRGYERPELWSEQGWAWRQEAGLVAPQFWTHEDDGTWMTRSMDREMEVDPARPVCHVCWYEAEAYARWAGGRLPTEQEWEAAATWDPAAGTKRTYPWGDEPPSPLDANLDQLAFETAQVGAYPRNVSPIGCYGMIGDVWEWTSSDFAPYPGYETFPYKEYSEVFFGPDYKVLRGGSWATRPGAIRGTFRNWDYPIRRQIFSGFRIVRDD